MCFPPTPSRVFHRLDPRHLLREARITSEGSVCPTVSFLYNAAMSPVPQTIIRESPAEKQVPWTTLRVSVAMGNSNSTARRDRPIAELLDQEEKQLGGPNARFAGVKKCMGKKKLLEFTLAKYDEKILQQKPEIMENIQMLTDFVRDSIAKCPSTAVQDMKHDWHEKVFEVIRQFEKLLFGKALNPADIDLIGGALLRASFVEYSASNSSLPPFDRQRLDRMAKNSGGMDGRYDGRSGSFDQAAVIKLIIEPEIKKTEPECMDFIDKASGIMLGILDSAITESSLSTSSTIAQFFREVGKGILQRKTDELKERAAENIRAVKESTFTPTALTLFQTGFALFRKDWPLRIVYDEAEIVIREKQRELKQLIIASVRELAENFKDELKRELSELDDPTIIKIMEPSPEDESKRHEYERAQKMLRNALALGDPPMVDGQEDVSQFNENLRKMIHLVDSAFKILDDVSPSGMMSMPEFPSPRIVLMGNTSVGKSSLLVGVIGTKAASALPSGEGVATRCPIEMRLYSLKEDHENGPLYAIFPEAGGEVMKDFQDVGEEVTRQMEKCAGLNGFSNKVIVLEIYSTEFPARFSGIQIIDVPGTVANATRGQDHLTKEITMELIKPTSSIILAVSDANDALVNSTAEAMAEEVDPNRERTIGVLTKLDKLSRNDSIPEAFYGNRPFFGVMKVEDKETGCLCCLRCCNR